VAAALLFALAPLGSSSPYHHRCCTRASNPLPHFTRPLLAPWFSYNQVCVCDPSDCGRAGRGSRAPDLLRAAPACRWRLSALACPHVSCSRVFHTCSRSLVALSCSHVLHTCYRASALASGMLHTCACMSLACLRALPISIRHYHAERGSRAPDVGRTPAAHMHMCGAWL
jgi:hypothetical protein